MRILIWDRQECINRGEIYGPDYAGCTYCLIVSVGDWKFEAPFNGPEELPRALELAGKRLQELTC